MTYIPKLGRTVSYGAEKNRQLHKQKVDRHKELLQLKKEGKNRAEILEEMGITYSALTSLAYRAGIELPFKKVKNAEC